MTQGATISERLTAALRLPNGARFYRCALQMNPFAYLSRYGKSTLFSDEDAYNKAIIETCFELGIEVIGVTDHYRVQESVGLVQAARAAGLFAFSGFEATSKDGVHFLCLFDPEKDAVLERFLGECGIHDTSSISPTGSQDCLELLACAKRWGGICIAAHVAGEGGLLKKLSGQPRVQVWTSQELTACALAGPIDQAPENLRSILANKDAQHRRDRLIAIINAQDVNSPDDLRKPGSSCYIKMSRVSVEGLRQAFLDPESRVRLHTDPGPEPHAEFLAMSWEGGFLTDTSIHFNPNLNVLIGGRGTGKSTLIESLRYVLGLDPLGEEARKAHEGVLKNVLRNGTKISLLVHSHHPSSRSYTIERTVPNPPVVKDEAGELLTLSPKDIIKEVEIFGQHEIAELTKSGEKLTLLLGRFIEHNPALDGRKNQLRLELEKSRSRILDTQRGILAIDERLAALPSLEETLTRFQEAGLEEKLKEKSLLVREERILTVVAERVEPLRILHRDFVDTVPLDTAFASPKALQGLPNADILVELGTILDRASAEVASLAQQFASILSRVDTDLAAVRQRWNERQARAEAVYEAVLRELQKSKIDGEEFIRLRRQIEELRPLREKREQLARDLAAFEAHRHKLLSEWEDTKAAHYRAIDTAAKKVSRKLRDRVRVDVQMAGNIEPLERLLREKIGGNLTAALERLKNRPQLSLPDLAARCREGRHALTEHYGIPQGAAERIAQAGPELCMRIEELELPATTEIALNTAAEGASAVWQTLDQLSTGQKATAVLLLLLLESNAPLVVDQPEDDLDNRFITDGVVPTMREEKGRRQFVFSTHNANIPVLGDAELILGLAASGEGREGNAKIADEHMGSIDEKSVRMLVEEILEGGRTAFEMRRLKYGF